MDPCSFPALLSTAQGHHQLSIPYPMERHNSHAHDPTAHHDTKLHPTPGPSPHRISLTSLTPMPSCHLSLHSRARAQAKHCFWLPVWPLLTEQWGSFWPLRYPPLQLVNFLFVTVFLAFCFQRFPQPTPLKAFQTVLPFLFEQQLQHLNLLPTQHLGKESSPNALQLGQQPCPWRAF